MPTWGEQLKLLQTRTTPDGQPALDEIRAEALNALFARTGRPTVVYASRWVQGDMRTDLGSVSVEDVQAFMEVLHGVKGPALDLVLHSPGGNPMAAEAVISYIRKRFTDVRVIVPLAAMSAATMMACAANRIVMAKHSYLGPIDPQIILQTPLGHTSVPAHLIQKQFEMAKDDAKNDGASFPAWLPMLNQ